MKFVLPRRGRARKSLEPDVRNPRVKPLSELHACLFAVRAPLT